MHPDFSEWYKSAGIPQKADNLMKRWVSAIKEYMRQREMYIVSMARFFYRLGKSGEEFLGRFRAVFQLADPAFPMRVKRPGTGCSFGCDAGEYG